MRELGRQLLDAQRGVSLVEVLMALALLTVVLTRMLDFGALLNGMAPYQRHLAITVATAKIEELGNQAYRTNPDQWPNPGNDSDTIDVGRFTFTREWVVTSYVPTDNDFSKENLQLRRALVIVSCNNCTKRMPPVKVVTVLGKL